MNALKTFTKYIVIVALGVVVGFAFGSNVTFSVQKLLAASISGISSILFGVLGIWVGIMAPESLKTIYSSQPLSTKHESWESLKYLFRPIFMSLFLFSAVTLFLLFGEIVHSFPFFLNFSMLFRQLGFSFIVTFVILTLELIRLSIHPGFELIVTSSNYLHSQKSMEDLTKKF